MQWLKGIGFLQDDNRRGPLQTGTNRRSSFGNQGEGATRMRTIGLLTIRPTYESSLFAGVETRTRSRQWSEN